MIKAFIDGQAGTTGLSLAKHLSQRADVQLLNLPDAQRKDKSARAALMNEADAVFLCLPDAAAIEAASFVLNPQTVVLDASTAHRTNNEWVYGFPEMNSNQRTKIMNAKRIAVPGCYATGFIALVSPLMMDGIIDPAVLLTCHALSGYSGGGKSMIEAYELPDRSEAFNSPRQYGLTQSHKHLPEMVHMTGLTTAPVFNPIVCDYFAGMVVSIPLHASMLKRPCAPAELCDIYRKRYAGSPFLSVADIPADGFLPANTLVGTNNLEIRVTGNAERFTLTTTLDNLGKGASGAAMQCMNIALGLDESAGFNAFRRNR